MRAVLFTAPPERRVDVTSSVYRLAVDRDAKSTLAVITCVNLHTVNGSRCAQDVADGLASRLYWDSDRHHL